MKPLLTDNETFDDYFRQHLGQVEVDASLAEQYWPGVKLSPTRATKSRRRIALWISVVIVILTMLVVLRKNRESQPVEPVAIPTDATPAQIVPVNPHQPDSVVHTKKSDRSVNVISCPKTSRGKGTMPDSSLSNKTQTKANSPSDKTETLLLKEDSLKAIEALRLPDTMQTIPPAKPPLPEKTKKKAPYIIW